MIILHILFISFSHSNPTPFLATGKISIKQSGFFLYSNITHIEHILFAQILMKVWRKISQIECFVQFLATLTNLCLGVNQFVTNGLSHPYTLDEFIFIFRGVRCKFIFISFFDEIHLSKQNSPRWDAAFCGVTSEAILVAYVP